MFVYVKKTCVMNKYMVIEIYVVLFMGDNLKLINLSEVLNILVDLCFTCCHRTIVNLQMP